jgi:hypothetical protein
MDRRLIVIIVIVLLFVFIVINIYEIQFPTDPIVQSLPDIMPGAEVTQRIMLCLVFGALIIALIKWLRHAKK